MWKVMEERDDGSVLVVRELQDHWIDPLVQAGRVSAPFNPGACVQVVVDGDSVYDLAVRDTVRGFDDLADFEGEIPQPGYDPAPDIDEAPGVVVGEPEETVVTGNVLVAGADDIPEDDDPAEEEPTDRDQAIEVLKDLGVFPNADGVYYFEDQDVETDDPFEALEILEDMED